MQEVAVSVTSHAHAIAAQFARLCIIQPRAFHPKPQSNLWGRVCALCLGLAGWRAWGGGCSSLDCCTPLQGLRPAEELADRNIPAHSCA